MSHKHLGVLLAAMTLGAATVIPAQAGDFIQLSGADRYGTSVAISQHAYPASATNVYLARGDVLADALSAGSLPGGPIVLVRKDGGNSKAASYVSSLKISGKVIALGGPAVLPDQVLSEVAGGHPTARIYGENRYDTSAEIARQAFPKGAPVVYLTNGYGQDGNGSPDAVAGGSLSDGPVILVNPRGSNAAANEAIRDLKAKQVIFLGGPGAVSDSVLGTEGGSLPQSRLAGSNRFQTSLLIAQRAFPQASKVFYVARGDVFADAVSGGALFDGPIVLSTTGLSPNVNYASGYRASSQANPIFLGGNIWQPDTMSAIAAGKEYTQPSPQPNQKPSPEPSQKPSQKPSPKPSQTLDFATAADREEAVILTGINARRAQDGVAALTRDPALDAMARDWSKHMAQTGQFEHSTNSPTGFRSFLGSKCRTVGENIDFHSGYTPAGSGGSRHVQNWIHSPGHFANLMDSSYTTTGIGVWFVDSRTSLATQVFCG